MRDAKKGLRLYAHGFASQQRPKGQRVHDWCHHVALAMQCVNAWAGQELIAQRTVLEMINLRHRHLEMGRLLLSKPQPTWEELLQLAKAADEEAALKKDLVSKKNTLGQPRVNQVAMFSDSDEASVSPTPVVTSSSSRPDRHCQAYKAHEAYCRKLCSVLSVDSINYVRKMMKEVDGSRLIPFSDLPHLKNVYCREHKHVSGIICPFHSLNARGCKPMRGECYFKNFHTERKKEYCPVGGDINGKFKCAKGALCEYRHVDDEYVLWVPRRNGMARRFVLRDTKSSWSVHKRSGTQKNK